jgi:hypothetical protein
MIAVYGLIGIALFLVHNNVDASPSVVDVQNLVVVPLAAFGLEAGWKRVRVGTVSLAVPDYLVEDPGQPIDSPSKVLTGPHMSIVIDQGPFADRLAGMVNCPGYRKEYYNLAGTNARAVFCLNEGNAGYTIASHVPELNHLTVAIRAGEMSSESTARRILESIQGLDY